MFKSKPDRVGIPFAQARFGIAGASYPALDSGQLLSHATENAPISKAKSRYPVLIFSHGLGFTSFSYTIQLEALASHGYVIAGIDHTYDTQIVVFPDGRAIPLSHEWETFMTSGDPARAKAFQIPRNEVGAADIRLSSISSPKLIRPIERVCFPENSTSRESVLWVIHWEGCPRSRLPTRRANSCLHQRGRAHRHTLLE